MATSAPVLPKLIGQRIKRREDPRLIQGRGTYVDDLKITGMQHLAFKRSDIAHGRIRSLDVSAARSMPGVEAVFTGADVAAFMGPMPIGTPFPSPDHRAVAVDTVRYVGEPVAVGSRDGNRFYPGIGTLFLRMMGETLATALKRFDG